MSKGKRVRGRRADEVASREVMRGQAEEYAEYLRAEGLEDVTVVDREPPLGFWVLGDGKLYGSVDRHGATLPKLRYPRGQEPPPLSLEEVLRRMCGP